MARANNAHKCPNYNVAHPSYKNKKHIDLTCLKCASLHTRQLCHPYRNKLFFIVLFLYCIMIKIKHVMAFGLVFGLLCLAAFGILVSTFALLLHKVSKDSKPTPDPTPEPTPEPTPIVGTLKYGCANDALNEDAPYSCRLMTPEEGGRWTTREDCKCWSCNGLTCRQITDSQQVGVFPKCSTCAYSCM